MNPEQYIQKYGGKAGGYFYLRDLGGFEKNLPPLIALIGRDEEVPSEFNNITGPVIARASHPNDIFGLVDILLTKNVKDIQDLKKECESIRKHADHETVHSYSEYEGMKYDAKITIMIQKFMGLGRGSILEHPHERGTFLIDIPWIDVMNDRVCERYFIKGKECAPRGDAALHDTSTEVLFRILDLYKRFQDTGFISEEFSAQMEFGMTREGIQFYQGRAFRKYEEPRFEVKSLLDSKYCCFGSTPEQGIELPVIVTYGRPEDVEVNHDFAMAIHTTSHTPPIPGFQPKRMKAFLPIGSASDSLEHNTFRWAQKAPVTVSDPIYRSKLQQMENGEKVHIKCNGVDYRLRFPK